MIFNLKKWNHIGSMIIDFMAAYMFLSIVWNLISLIIPAKILVLSIVSAPKDGNLLVDLVKVYLGIIILIIVYTYYNYLSIRLFKRTFGKFILHVYIVDQKSKKNKLQIVSNSQILKREFIKWFLFFATFSIYGIYCLLAVLFTKNIDELLLYHDQKTSTKVKVIA